MEMTTNATNEEIISYIKQLIDLLGIRKNIPEQTLEKLRTMYQNRQTSKCVAEVKSLLRLDLTIKIGYLNTKPDAASLIKLIIEHYPELKYEKVDLAYIKEQLDKAAAFAVNPPYLPMYGSPEFYSLKILMFIFRWFMNNSFETFIYCIAHELTHIVLRAIRHPLQNSEVAVDLTAMILGFSDVIRIGRKCRYATIGYLDDHKFQLAYEEIRKYNKIIYL